MAGARERRVVVSMAAVALLSCRQPTQITLELTTDVPCEVLREKGVAISAGALGAVESKPPSEVKYACEGGKIGTMVVVPSGEKTAEVEVRVVAGVTSRAETCEAGNRYAGCIVARRALRYVEHEGLKVRVELRQECANVACDEGERRTCVKGGVCVSGEVERPEACAGEGCGEEGLVKGGGGGSGGGGSGGESGSGGGTCGNGKREGSEACDGSDVGGATCASAVGSGSTGSVSCTGSCALNTSGCSSPSVVKPSCNGMAKTCGASGNDDCCATEVVPGGIFPMGQDDGANEERPEHETEVATYGLDRYEVTVGRFRKFVAAYDAFRATLKEGMGAHPLIGGSGWQAGWTSSLPGDATALKSALKCDPTYPTWVDSAGGASVENRPVNCVTWYEAYAFCLWDGGRMPTEAEWEYAAAGGSDNRLYPWGGQAPDKTLAVHGCLFSGTSSCGAADLPVVGSTPAGKGRYGQMDLAGSLYEWNLDWYSESWYTTYSSPGYCKNCANVSSGSDRVIRGGSFYGGAGALRAAYRYPHAPADRGSYLGVRCARAPLRMWDRDIHGQADPWYLILEPLI